jgi:excisionase family DNA binding protein
VPPRFVTVKFISEDLDVPEDTVREWIRQKKLPAYRVGREYRIKREEYEKFLRESRTFPDEEDKQR